MEKQKAAWKVAKLEVLWVDNWESTTAEKMVAKKGVKRVSKRDELRVE